MVSTADTNPDYWKAYSNLQHVKHALIKEYLNGWLPKLTLGQWGSGRVLYIDTHAGRGRHARGQLGSPLVALKTLLEHSSRDLVLKHAEVNFFFIEIDERNVHSLKKELKEFGDLPKNVNIEATAGDCFEILDEILSNLDQEGERLAPSLIFLDPYGFKVPGSILRRLMGFPRVELFVNVIWRELDMAICQAIRQAGRMAETLDLVFEGCDWRNEINADHADERGEQCVNLLRTVADAKWATYIRMVDRARTRYFLAHLSNHDAGREYMKDCMFKVCPDGSYCAQKSDNSAQQLLIQPEMDLHPIEAWVLERLSRGPQRWQGLLDESLAQLWLKKHVNLVVRSLRHRKLISADQYSKSFNPTNNPRLFVVENS